MGAGKCKAISKLCNKHNISFLGIQETHSPVVDPFIVKCFWGNFQFDYATCPSVGRSGGLVSVWDPNSFTKINVFPFDNVLIVEGNWTSTQMHCYMVNVYAPQEDRKKVILWNQILEFKEANPGHYIIFGDFNVVRTASERIGTVFNSKSTNVFNQFISNAHLWEIPHGGHLFTRINRRGDKLSKLDRFLISENSSSHMHNYSAQVLDCHISDHRPIILSATTVDFGPSPFKLFNSWLLDNHLHTIITDFWESNMADYGPNPKQNVKWGNEADENSNSFHISHQKRRTLSIHGIKYEGQWLTDPLRIKDAFYSFFEAKFKKGDVSKIDTRSMFYKSLSEDQNAFLISPVSDSEIRAAIWDCGSEKSPGPDGFSFVFYKKFWDSIKSDVIAFVKEFLKTGIIPKGCNTSFIALIPKTSNPMVVSDFRPISLIGTQYKIIAKVLANRLAQVIDSIISREQSAFIKQRQILDGPLMVNEVIKWCNRKKSKLMVFKIDFEKAFDSVSWDYLFRVMNFMGFSEKWISWIKGCLYTATASILVNGSPTCEYHINRGLRQGDPLSPFLFIIAMEGLHVAVEDAISAGLYRGITVNTLTLSHLFFADDALFIGEWSRTNIKNMVSILDCFHKASGLKINLHKSNLIGIGVPFEEVKHFSQVTGCNALQSSFSYLGLPIDRNMASIKSWDPIIDKFSKRLSKWKASLLSIGGRSTLISSVLGAIGTYYFSLFPMPATVNAKLESLRSNFFWGSDIKDKKISWVSWKLVLASKEKGGLGIGSLYSLNHALIQKWRWRYFNNPHALWVQVIKAIYGKHGDDPSFYNHVRDQGIWGRIVKAINSLHEKELVPLSFLQRRVGNGDSTKFWHETWMGNSPLKSQFPRLFRLALNKDCTIRECWNNGWDLSWSRPITSGTNSQHLSTVLNLLSSFTLSDAEDSWSWSLGSPSFTVKCTREHIDNNILPDGGMETRWNRYLPKKINIFIWRVLRDRLPTRWNLSRKGIDLDSLNCPICDTSVETTNHSLWFCSLATTLWHRVFVWLDIAPPNPSNIQDVFSWLDNMRLSSAQKSALEVICGVVFWSLWHFRNKLIFDTSPPNRSILFDNIVDCSYRWFSSRNNKCCITWNSWMRNPLRVSTL
ncbi:RNA-directed DNA polymerase, eukaryota, reverse transcriptase zinc-binding domain protein [Tanacetum coccineum]|uniref:RNA-directed DNA polymerase, eukaryota, reverse transcriptase zinc-binding domain protein n=1 Tax=Tanacetum coccineum TaxID=301880 RepID=A0ABQ4ZK71_9ASTR